MVPNQTADAILLSFELFERLSELMENLSDVSKSKNFVDFIKVTTATINRIIPVSIASDETLSEQKQFPKRPGSPPKKATKAEYQDCLVGNTNWEPMTKKITKGNLTSEKKDCSTRNSLPRDTTMAQKSHDKIKISKLYWLNCRLCPFKTRKKDLMIEHMCSAHI